MTSPDTAILFGAYRLVPSERALFNSEQPVRLSGRAFDLLLALLERPGEVLSKDELIARVWPRTCVEEGNLRVHIGALRKVLHDASGSLYVENVVGRGYSFVAPVRRVVHPAQHAQAPAAGTSALPLLNSSRVGNSVGNSVGGNVGRIFGRDDTLRQLAAQVPQRRLVTVVGPGGMGKTTVAVAASGRLARGFTDGAVLVDLAPLTDGAQVSSALALALGMPSMSSDPGAALVAHLHDMHALLVFDNCEHVIDSVASLVERLLRQTPRVHVLATSREPLRADAQAGYERVEFLFPYSYPVEQIAHRLCSHGLQLVRHCLPAGDWVGGERGVACLPDRTAEFRYGVEEAIRYARPLGVRQLRCLAGLLLPDLAPDLARQTLVSNLRYAAATLKPHGIGLYIAPHSVADAACMAGMASPVGASDAANHFLTGSAQALAIIRDTGSDNLFLQD
eukprot:gene28132-34944_t